MKKIVLFSTILLLIVSSPQLTAQEDEHGNLQLENDYIEIFVNQNQSNKGRFAIHVTGGDPMRDGDNNKPLVYGHPHPWTSYTTIRIDGENYIFGGETDRRAGRGGNYGKLLQAPTIEDEQIITTYKFGEVVVDQILSFVKSTTTGLPDTARIEYQVKNTGEEIKEVGSRIMIDTLLGENDGAPFRVEDQIIDGDKVFLRDEHLPDFWQTFDSLEDPKVTSQGTVVGPNLTAPDEMYFTNWGSLADAPWEFNFDPGRDFIREGEFELDSAMALFWQPEDLQPGESRTYATKYGLGGITIVPGLLSVGVTSPSTVVMERPDKTVDIIAYIQNTAEITVEDVEVELDLPEDLELVSSDKKEVVGDLEPGETLQRMWQVRPKDFTKDNFEYTVKVDAENTDANQVSRSLEVVGPPDLSLDLIGPDQIRTYQNRLEEDSFLVNAEIKNEGFSPAYDVSAQLALPPGLSVSRGEIEEKKLGYLLPGESIQLSWRIDPLQMVSGELPYIVEVSSDNASNRISKKEISLPSLESKAEFEVLDLEEGFEEGDYLTVEVKLNNLISFYRGSFDIGYNDDVLEPIYISRGNLFVESGDLLSWNSPEIDREEAKIEGVSGALDAARSLDSETFAQLHFRVKSHGELGLEFLDFNLYDRSEEEIELELEDKAVYIGGS
ncbi:NEW3 domain-containing protein [Natroniella sulfidigena]|uniref:NEW3 domain-containing protein n=1 Tax=Natroniella sulfidigena TaxID=723921 RepID=UPI00200B0890|nr:NEW3 domain-containing protein [Natroniella sulfidigena]